jgi:predicted hydrocarbon binding protein
MTYKVAETAEELASEINAIELDVLTNYRLSDAIREGSKYSKQSRGWGDGKETACAMSAGFMAARARGFLK